MFRVLSVANRLTLKYHLYIETIECICIYLTFSASLVEEF